MMRAASGGTVPLYVRGLVALTVLVAAASLAAGKGAPADAAIAEPLDGTAVARGVPVSFRDGSGTRDNCSPVAWTWDFGDGTGSTVQDPVHAYAPETPAGDMVVTLHVRYEGACRPTSTATVLLDVVNLPPTVTLDGPLRIEAGETAAFRASGLDPDRAVASYRFTVDETATESTTGDLEVALSIGSHTVEVVAIDDEGALSAPAALGVEVVDTTPPILAPVVDLSVEATSAGGADVAYASPTWSDREEHGIAACEPGPGAFPLGATTVTCTAVDAAGNFAEARFEVDVDDTTAPILAAVADVRMQPDDEGGAVLDYEPPAVDDAVDGPGRATCTPGPGTRVPRGATLVTCTAVDAAGNTAEPVSFTVFVENASPSLSAPAHLSVHDGTAVAFVLDAADPDGDAVSLRAVDLPEGAALDAATGAFAWTPRWDQVGRHAIVVAASDGAAEVVAVTTVDVVLDPRRDLVAPAHRRVVVASPGVASTLILELRNDGAVDDHVVVRAAGPAAWSLAPPPARVVVPAGATVAVPILVVPHDRPMVAAVALEAESLTGRTVAASNVVLVPLVVLVEVDAPASPAHDVIGRVRVTWADGRPVPGERVTVSESLALLPPGVAPRTLEVVTGEDGAATFRFAADPVGSTAPGEHRVEAEATRSVGASGRATAAYRVA